ncbi:hypothetical protein GCM10023085_45240 [Actinomadura viridis]|uniref:CHAP domain-containing protein n=1 Tax=Actinomadura viridis TaxID=58110 RepID=A0A931GK65_9ACTN|nr:peptidoglycan-binding protein [Actinomadura viridis]MBG6089885.1 hypothetical protein [Actinomadura viridis]
MLAEARKSLGLAGRPNYITRDYASRYGDEFLRAPWCDMAVTYWARRSGNAAAVLLGGDRAFTVWHAQDFQNAGRWHTGTAANVDRAKPGDIVFFDWGASNSIGAIDHVGIIEKVLGGGRVQTIEGNTGDACKRRVRDASTIAGYGRPYYSGSGTDAPYKWSGKAPAATLRPGDVGDKVRDLQNALLRAGQTLPVYGADGDYGGETETAVKTFQRSRSLTASGVYDVATAALLQRALAPQVPEEDEEVRYYGQLTDGPSAITPISLHPGDVGAIGFVGDNDLAKLPPAKLRVAVHDAKGWYAQHIVVDSTRPKPWFKFRDPTTTDGVSVQREDDGAVPVAWDAS